MQTYRGGRITTSQKLTPPFHKPKRTSLKYYLIALNHVTLIRYRHTTTLSNRSKYVLIRWTLVRYLTLVPARYMCQDRLVNWRCGVSISNMFEHIKSNIAVATKMVLRWWLWSIVQILSMHHTIVLTASGYWSSTRQIISKHSWREDIVMKRYQ